MASIHQKHITNKRQTQIHREVNVRAMSREIYARKHSLTLHNSSRVTAVLSVDLGGHLNLNGSNGIVIVPISNAWPHT